MEIVVIEIKWKISERRSRKVIIDRKKSIIITKFKQSKTSKIKWVLKNEKIKLTVKNCN